MAGERRSELVIYYKCRIRTCKGRGHNSGGAFQSNGARNHVSDEEEAERRKTIYAMKTRVVEQNTVSIAGTYHAVVSKLQFGSREFYVN